MAGEKHTHEVPREAPPEVAPALSTPHEPAGRDPVPAEPDRDAGAEPDGPARQVQPDGR